MKKSTILLTLFAAFGLAACGGSDGPDLGLKTVPNVPPGVGGNTGGNTGNADNNGGGVLPPKKEDIKLDLGANKANLGIDAMTMKAPDVPLYEKVKEDGAEFDVEYGGVKYKKTDTAGTLTPVVIRQGETVGSVYPEIIVNDSITGQRVVATKKDVGKAAAKTAADATEAAAKFVKSTGADTQDIDEAAAKAAEAAAKAAGVTIEDAEAAIEAAKAAEAAAKKAIGEVSKAENTAKETAAARLEAAVQAETAAKAESAAKTEAAKKASNEAEQAKNTALTTDKTAKDKEAKAADAAKVAADAAKAAEVETAKVELAKADEIAAQSAKEAAAAEAALKATAATQAENAAKKAAADAAQADAAGKAAAEAAAEAAKAAATAAKQEADDAAGAAKIAADAAKKAADEASQAVKVAEAAEKKAANEAANAKAAKEAETAAKAEAVAKAEAAVQAEAAAQVAEKNAKVAEEAAKAAEMVTQAEADAKAQADARAEAATQTVKDAAKATETAVSRLTDPTLTNIPLKEITAALDADSASISMLKITSQESKNVFDREISLNYPTDVANDFNDGSNSYISNNLSYARFGALYDARKVDRNSDYGTHFFALGQVTPETDMAKFADVTDALYEGAAYYSLYSQPVKNYNNGKVAFTVNFKDKNIVGVLELPDTQQKREYLQAKITGNSFEGRHLGGNWMKGKFYGPDAAEMAGIFEGKSRKWITNDDEPKGFIGSFGAVKK